MSSLFFAIIASPSSLCGYTLACFRALMTIVVIRFFFSVCLLEKILFAEAAQSSITKRQHRLNLGLITRRTGSHRSIAIHSLPVDYCCDAYSLVNRRRHWSSLISDVREVVIGMLDSFAKSVCLFFPFFFLFFRNPGQIFSVE